MNTQIRSKEFAEIEAIHSHDDKRERMIHHWINAFPMQEDWELDSGVSDIVAASIPSFLDKNSIRIHATIGISSALPSFRSVRTTNTPIHAPRDVVYFCEDPKMEERFVLAVISNFGSLEISFYSSTCASKWIDLLRSHARLTNHLRGQTFDLGGQLVQNGDISIQDVVLTDEQKRVIDRHIIGYARHFNELQKRGARAQRGVLLEGIPGCGKSMLLRAIANELHGISVCIAGPDQICQSGSIAVLKELVRMTEPCAVFIEEIDIFCHDRSLGPNPGMAELMQIMDGLQNISRVLWVGTTNRPEVVETALANRPGRFDRRLKFGPLEDADRSRLVDRLILPQKLTPEAHRLATKLTKGMTGAQVHDLVETLRIISSDELFDIEDIEAAWEDCGFNVDVPFGFAPMTHHIDESPMHLRTNTTY